MNTVEVTDRTFEELVLNSGKPVLADFWATWCGPCKAMMPVLEEIAGTHSSALTIAKINIEDNPGSAKFYRVMTLPTLILFRDRQPVKTIIGAKSKDELLAEIAAHAEI
jgi:thioredoxin 1